jgi:hypothetical protein
VTTSGKTDTPSPFYPPLRASSDCHLAWRQEACVGGGACRAKVGVEDTELLSHSGARGWAVGPSCGAGCGVGGGGSSPRHLEAGAYCFLATLTAVAETFLRRFSHPFYGDSNSRPSCSTFVRFKWCGVPECT